MILQSYNEFSRLEPQKSNLCRLSIATPGDSLFVASPHQRHRREGSTVCVAGGKWDDDGCQRRWFSAVAVTSVAGGMGAGGDGEGALGAGRFGQGPGGSDVVEAGVGVGDDKRLETPEHR